MSNENYTNTENANNEEINHNIVLYENYIYNYMDKTPTFENYLIFTIQKLNDIAGIDNNILNYEFSYQISQILITYQKDLRYGKKSFIFDNLNIVNNIKKFLSNDYNIKYNLNTNNLKYFLSNIKNNIQYNKFKILNFGFINVITINSNDPEMNYELIKNTYLGFKFFNDLKKYFPSFEYIYCYMKCTKIDNDNFDNKNWCNKTDNINNLVPYVITDIFLYNKTIHHQNLNLFENDLKILHPKNLNLFQKSLNFQLYYFIEYKYKNFNKDDNFDPNDYMIGNIIIQFLNILNYIKTRILNNVNESDKNLILNFNICEIYTYDIEYYIPLFNNSGDIYKYFKTNKILYIPIIFNNVNNTQCKNINYFLNNFLNKFENIQDFFDSLNKKYNDPNNIYHFIENYKPNKLSNNLLNKYYYNLLIKNKNNDKKYELKDIFEKKYSISNILSYFLNNNYNNTIDIKLSKFGSEYCLNDLKYMNKSEFNSAKKKELEILFNVLIDDKIKNLNNELNKNILSNNDIISTYNKYTKFIDNLVKAKCLDYKIKLYDIFKLKINLSDNINNSNIEGIEKYNMIYTIEESYKNLPNSNFFLNFISKTPLIDIIINAFIYYLFIYCVFFLYSFIMQNNSMMIIGKSILAYYITSKNFGMIKKSLNYGIKIASYLFNSYSGNFAVNWYRKLYQNGFINIPSSIFNKFDFILPQILKILIPLSVIPISFKKFNYVIDAINKKLFSNSLLRFKIGNLLSGSISSIISFMWKKEVKDKNTTNVKEKQDDVKPTTDGEEKQDDVEPITDGSNENNTVENVKILSKL